MGYIPTEWETGDIITAAKLNKAEEGISGAYSLVTATFNTTSFTSVLDKTYGEIEQIMASGIVPVLKNVVDDETANYFIVETAQYDNSTEKYLIRDSNSTLYYAVDPDDYPETAGPG